MKKFDWKGYYGFLKTKYEDRDGGIFKGDFFPTLTLYLSILFFAIIFGIIHHPVFVAIGIFSPYVISFWVGVIYDTLKKFKNI